MSDHAKKDRHHHKTDKKKKKNSDDHDHDNGALSGALQSGDFSEDESGIKEVPADAPKNLEGDVVAVMKKPGELCLVTANVGADQGITHEMTAYLLAADHTHYDFTIEEVRDGATTGWVDSSEDFVAHHSTMRVVFNPG